MAIDNYENNPMKMVNLSNGVSNMDWTKMIEEIYNQEDELEIGPEKIVDLAEIEAEAIAVNPKAKGLRLSKISFKTFQSKQKNDCEKII